MATIVIGVVGVTDFTDSVAHHYRVFPWLVAHLCTLFCNIGFLFDAVVGFHKTVFVAHHCTLFCNIYIALKFLSFY